MPVVSHRTMSCIGLVIAGLPLTCLAVPLIKDTSHQIRSAAARREGLEQVKNFYLADRCIRVNSESTRPLIKGDIIETPAETSCYLSDGNFLYVETEPSTGSVIISQVYSPKEVDNYISQTVDPNQ